MNILIISAFVPYNKVSHAGGKVHNYYIKRLAQNKLNTINLITCASIYERDKIDYDPRINYDIYFHNSSDSNLFTKYLRKAKHLFELLNPFHKYCHLITYDFERNMLHKVSDLAKTGYIPDVISLEWTQCLFLFPEIKKLFPNSKICCFEHDVTFLGYQRKYQRTKIPIIKSIKYSYFKRIKEIEIKNAKQCDWIYVLESKDKVLLEKEEIPSNKIRIIAPYYDKYSSVVRKGFNSDIIFFGAMNRVENYNSAIWFIKNVLNLLPKECRFIIIGGNPPNLLKKYASDRIIITGFVDDITPWLQKSLCMVVPLILGAGIKVKVLEGFSAGIPILTNNIGIEGIDAIDGKHYLHCEQPEDYSRNISYLLNNPDENKRIGLSGKCFVEENINYSISEYIGN